MKITEGSNLSNITDATEFQKQASKAIAQISMAINGNIEPLTNLKCQQLAISFAAADIDTPFGHGLNRVPVGYFVIGASVAMSVYSGSVPMNSDVVTLRSSAAGTATILIF